MRASLLRAAVAVVAVSALAVLVVALTQITFSLTTLALALLMLLGGALRFKVLPNHPAALDSVALVAVFVIAGPWTAVAVSVFGYVAQLRQPSPLVKRIFNPSYRVLAAAGGGAAYALLGGPVGSDVLDDIPRTVVAAMAGTIGHQLANALLLSLILWLEGQVRVVDFLKSVIGPTFLPMLGYSALGVLLAVTWIGGLGIASCLLVVGPLLVVRWALSQYQAERAAQAATMRAFIQVIETKDLYTRGHSERVSAGVGMLGRQLGLPEDRQNALEHAGLLHDVGKVGVPTSIIRKPGKLDDAEMDAIRLHPARGVELIGNIPFLEEVKSAVLHHHEKYDGTGYPAGLSGTHIPFFARIIGIVDAFDCLTSTRSYRPARSVDETLAILVQDKTTHFDPELVDAFVQVIRTQGWSAAAADQPAPDQSVQVSIDHDDLSLGTGGGASGSAAGPA
ncbi:HD-GYP domain-containing protein [Kribbella sp. NPDC049227]|uniref:HD-GYP domain-containing protein n=1 Tax=Kribbella sp. NPDC049227 TaxID=3364113 RepID=UPI00371037E6